jgi:SAM-dependent methyltransferase
MNHGESLTRSYFEALYDQSEDPWSFATSAYEREKYDRSLAALQQRYATALEIGCSIGVFTRGLAERCGDLLAIDISDRALDRARKRCAALPQVRFARAEFPRDVPGTSFDLVTCCEVGYYWSDDDLTAARDRIAQILVQRGDLLLVHFLPRVAEYVRDGDAVHAAFLADPRFAHLFGSRTDRYRLDLLRRR